MALRKPEAAIAFGSFTRFGDHPRMAEGENGIREDPVRRAFDGDHVGESQETRLGRGVVGRQRLAEQPRRRGDEDESAVAL